MSITIRQAVKEDLDAVERLYNDLTDRLRTGPNYPGWKSGVYPLRCDAEEGLADGTLYVAELDGCIAGTVMYPETQGAPYQSADWQLPFDVPVITLHILAVHPAYQGRGVGRALLKYAEDLGKRRGALAVRLDTREGNLPACRLYEQTGYSMRGLIDLGLEEVTGFKWYRTYEKLLSQP